MGARMVLILLLGVALAAAAPVAPAGAASGNAVATQAYLKADYALMKVAQAKQGAAEGALQGLLNEIRGQCPNVAFASPQVTDSEQLSNELVGAMIVVATAPERQAIARYAHAVAGLRWSNARLTSTIKAYARQLSALSTMPAPNVCADVRTWVSSDYQTLPATTVQFDQSYKAVNVPIGELPEQLLAPYERPAQQGMLRSIRQLESSEADFEARAVNVWADAMNSMVLQP